MCYESCQKDFGFIWTNFNPTLIWYLVFAPYLCVCIVLNLYIRTYTEYIVYCHKIFILILWIKKTIFERHTWDFFVCPLISCYWPNQLSSWNQGSFAISMALLVRVGGISSLINRQKQSYFLVISWEMKFLIKKCFTLNNRRTDGQKMYRIETHIWKNLHQQIQSCILNSSLEK